MIEDRVLIAGAGPVGLVAAAQLVRKGIPVTVLEAGNELSVEFEGVDISSSDAGYA